MTDHQHGSMSVRSHEKTYEGFIKFATRAAIALAIFFVILAMLGA